MECFRIDESGYTGFDLLNAEQRFQGATAVAISDEDAARLIKEYFPKLQASELKYRSLARRSGNHPRLLGLQREILANYKCVTYVCDKRYLLLLMFLDYAVEPFYYERGLNFYEDGQNYALASLLYVVGPTLLGRTAFNDLQAAFQRAVREKTQAALGDLVVAARKTKWQELPEALGPLAQYAAPECLRAIATPGVSTDAAFVVLQSLVSRMEEMATGPYCVQHDQSKNLLTYHDLLQRFIHHDQEIEFRQSEIARIKFPLKLASVTQVDSKTSPGVQLADVMIGAAIEAANTLTGQRSGGLDAEAVMALYADHQFIHMVPSINFEEERRFRQGSQAAEVIDYFSAHFHDRSGS
ncbi:DUF3800 domain-containing protein [Pseudomonas aeruginosa]|nr:DUF3800 domain-containing protein [uncultured Pseudomonas sp.]EKQ6358021.1 DUF3800 domain-containing protein [Pseudomonas aeruginosa]MCT1015654.1 DUF3800 domain-containing protein [Pseudomonas aeruginosa]HCF3636096.1 DUF3800 domain-containing protein [Pseudomonas aeruginosa]HCF3683666.1 DUF3800 domain-containing protein [Pseudomonas aeruginosa]